MSTEDRYYVTRNCKNCGNEDNFYFSKREMAFRLYSTKAICDTPCTRCKSEECSGSSRLGVTMDKDLFKEWSLNDELYIEEQDEEIILAEETNLALIIELLDDPVTLRSKKQALYAALCVLIYDSINSNNKLLELVKTELIKRKEDFLKTEPFIMDYIRKEVFPIIGLE